MSYAQLTLKQRFRLEVWSEGVMTQEEMAFRLRVSPGTISREFSRSGGRKDYDARKAQSRSIKRRKGGKRMSKKLLSDPLLSAYVEEKLLLFWSPEQIAGRGKEERDGMVCPETIYQFIYDEKPEWKQYLRQKKGKYRRRWGTKQKEEEREEGKKKRIDTRPLIVETRGRMSDWEGDTIVGGEKTTGILTHTERKSGYLLWERGTNENTNGLLRQFFPKKMLFGTLKQKDVARVVSLINHRPRKRLGYLTPYEVFVEGKSVAVQIRM